MRLPGTTVPVAVDFLELVVFAVILTAISPPSASVPAVIEILEEIHSYTDWPALPIRKHTLADSFFQSILPNISLFYPTTYVCLI